MPWQIWVAVTVLAWGTWGFLNGLALRNHSWQQILVWGVPTMVVAAAALLAAFGAKAGFEPKAFVWATAIQLTAVIGVILFYQALKAQNMALVVPITAAYPAVTVILAVLFGNERLRPVQLLGILLVIAGTMAISVS